MDQRRMAMVVVSLLATAVSISLFFIPWQFVIAGYKFPYHGRPALLAAILALIVGAAGAYRGWRGNWRRRPWAIVCGLLAVQIGFQAAFIGGPQVFPATGTMSGPWGDSPIQLDLTFPPKWGVYGSAAAAAVGFLAAAGLFASVVFRNETNTASNGLK